MGLPRQANMGSRHTSLSTEDGFCPLPLSPCAEPPPEDTSFALVLSKQPGDLAANHRLPKHVTLKLTTTHCEFWDADASKAPIKITSYLNVCSWGHSPSSFVLTEEGSDVVSVPRMEVVSRKGRRANQPSRRA